MVFFFAKGLLGEIKADAFATSVMIGKYSEFFF